MDINFKTLNIIERRGLNILVIIYEWNRVDEENKTDRRKRGAHRRK